MLLAPTGIIPVPHDWQEALLFDFAYYLHSPTDGIGQDPDAVNWGVLDLDPEEDVEMHMPYGTPLTQDQMNKLISGGGN
jgi:hypothetical protein